VQAPAALALGFYRLRLVVYLDRERAFADLGLAPESGT
jgi:hypothetical protein